MQMNEYVNEIIDSFKPKEDIYFLRSSLPVNAKLLEVSQRIPGHVQNLLGIQDKNINQKLGSLIVKERQRKTQLESTSIISGGIFSSNSKLESDAKGFGIGVNEEKLKDLDSANKDLKEFNISFYNDFYNQLRSFKNHVSIPSEVAMNSNFSSIQVSHTIKQPSAFKNREISVIRNKIISNTKKEKTKLSFHQVKRSSSVLHDMMSYGKANKNLNELSLADIINSNKKEENDQSIKDAKKSHSKMKSGKAIKLNLALDSINKPINFEQMHKSGAQPTSTQSKSNMILWNSKNDRFQRILFWERRLNKLISNSPEEYFQTEFKDDCKVYFVLDGNNEIYTKNTVQGFFAKFNRYICITIKDFMKLLTAALGSLIPFLSIYTLYGVPISTIDEIVTSNMKLFYISTYTSAQFADSEFFSTMKFHLQNEGITWRTSRLKRDRYYVDSNDKSNSKSIKWFGLSNSLSPLHSEKSYKLLEDLNFPREVLFFDITRDLGVKITNLNLSMIKKYVSDNQGTINNKTTYTRFVNYNSQPFVQKKGSIKSNQILKKPSHQYAQSENYGLSQQSQSFHSNQHLMNEDARINYNQLLNSSKSNFSKMHKSVVTSDKSRLPIVNPSNIKHRDVHFKQEHPPQLLSNNQNTIFSSNKEADKSLIISNINRFPNISKHTFYDLLTKFSVLKRLGNRESKNKAGIDFITFFKGIPQMSVEEEDLVRKIYNSLKNKRHQTLELDQFVNGLSMIIQPDFKKKIDFFFKIIDTDGNGSLSFEEVKTISKMSLQRNIAEGDDDLLKNSDAVEDLAEHFAKNIFKISEVDIDKEISIDILKLHINNKEGGRALEMFCGSDNFMI